jgi:tetratricopeptide (TPR) repeat protein
MAGVFLSYDRDDSAAAKLIASALEKAGHSVWWDLHVRGGAKFTKVIEQALKAADVVVVLWSANSVESSWVCDEASAGRDGGRLVPAALDATLPPLGFRQFQTIDLRDWKRGTKSHGYGELEAAINEMEPPGPPHERPTDKETRSRVSARTAAVFVIPLLGAMAVAAYFLWPSSSLAVPTVTVLPASSSAMSQALSRDLLAKLGVLQASNSEALQLVEGGGGKIPDLIFKVDASNEGSASKATLLLLSGRNRAVLWSGDFEQPSDKPSDLKQQLAYSAANVLECASEAYGPAGQSLDDPTRRLYLNGCGAFTRNAGADIDSLVRIFHEVTRRAPRFEDGWARLVNAEDDVIFSPPFERDTPAMRATLQADIAAARKVNPDLAEAYIAEADSIPQERFVESLRLLDLAVERNPDNAGALVARAFAMTQLGRMKEAVSDARRAVQIRPFSPRAQDSYISALMYAGQFDAAREELSKAEGLFPGASDLESARFRLNLRYGSAEEALKQARKDDTQGLPEQEAFLKARIEPSPANVTQAVERARKQLDGSPLSTANYAQVLAEFGRTDELINFLLNWRRTDRGGSIGVIFRPTFHNFWRDPRSMQVAARFGLVQYWRSSGHWPDLCSWPDLPYDCKAVSAKLK